MATEYVVLKRGSVPPSGGAWIPIGEPVEAANDVAAIKAATAGEEDRSGTFVAVPLRSWQVVRAVVTKQIDGWT